MEVDQEPTMSSELGLANVGGVFLVLLIGCCGSFVIAVFEFLWNVRKVAVKEKVSLRRGPFPLLETVISPFYLFYPETSDNFPPRRVHLRARE